MFLCLSSHHVFDISLPSKPSHFINYGLTKFSIKKESKGPALNEKVVQENITVSKPAAQVMSEIPLESIFDDLPNNETEVFVEKGSNGGETKEAKHGERASSTSTRVVTTSRTVVKSDGSSPVTTVEKKVIVNGEEQPLDRNLLSPPAVEVEEKEDGSEEGDKGGSEKDDGEGSGGKPRQKVKKKRSFKKSFQGIINRRSRADKDEDEKK